MMARGVGSLGSSSAVTMVAWRHTWRSGGGLPGRATARGNGGGGTMVTGKAAMLWWKKNVSETVKGGEGLCEF
jgi:hypothetical protein